MKSQRASHHQPPVPPATLLSLRNPAQLLWEMQQLQLAIARRAYELFQARRCEHGHDWEDWFRAESELLRPVSISTSASPNQISLRANVLGFEENELKVSVEPHRIMILGKKERSTTETEGGNVECINSYPDQILQFIELSAEVIPENAVVELQAGQLKFELRKAESEAGPAGAAA